MEKRIYPYDFLNKVILVVEDDLANYKYFEFLLKEVNATVVWEKNGRDAVETFTRRSEEIDLVLMDILIPFITGVDATREIKKIRKEVPVVAISAYDTYDNRERCFLAGCNEYISKPVLPERLLATLACHLELEKPVMLKKSPSLEKPEPLKG